VIAVWVGAALDLCSRHAGWRRWFVLASAAAAVVLLAWLNRPSHANAEAFAQSIEQKLQGLERSAAVVGIIDYNVRMGLVHRLYAEGLGTERELHLDNDATPASVARYLRGEAALRDSHTRAALPLGLRLFVAPRSEDYAWGGSGLVLLPSRFGLREVKFARP
jgi:hypothetical protein